MKVLLLGLTGSGKSSVAKDLAKTSGLRLIEADDEALRMNGGVWPKDEEVIDKYFEKANDEILKEDGVLYVISWLEEKRIKEFKEKGFTILELHADYQTLIDRKVRRGNFTSEERKRFKNNYEGYLKVVGKLEVSKLLDLSLDTTKLSSKNVLTLISKYLKYN